MKLRQIAADYAKDMGYPNARIAGLVVAPNAALALVQANRRMEFVLLLERGVFNTQAWAVTDELSDPDDFYRNGGVCDDDRRGH